MYAVREQCAVEYNKRLVPLSGERRNPAGFRVSRVAFSAEAGAKVWDFFFLHPHERTGRKLMCQSAVLLAQEPNASPTS